MRARHVAIIGAGNVGATTAYALLQSDLVEKLSLIDINSAKAEGEALDLQDGVSFLHPTTVHWGDYELCRGAQVVVVTAGANQKPGQTRLDLLEQNATIINQVIPAILDQTDEAILLMVTNPVDPLTYLAMEISGLPPGQVIGSGTVLDTARLRNQLSLHCRIDPRNIHAYVIGGHGEGAVPVWSAAQIAGIKLEQYCRFCGQGCSAQDEIGRRVINTAERIIARKGATFYSIALTVVRIIRSILLDENSVLTVSTLVNDFYGISGICMSLPALINRQGVNEVLPLELAPDEIASLRQTAAILKKSQQQISRAAALEPV